MKKSISQNNDLTVLQQLLSIQQDQIQLQSENAIANHCAKSLSSVPGIGAGRVCLGGSFTDDDSFNNELCEECLASLEDDEKTPGFPKTFQCKLGQQQHVHELKVETPDNRFGFFLVIVNRPKLFERYRPFIQQLADFVATSLENRLYKQQMRTTGAEGNKKEQQEHSRRPHFFESMDRINKALQGSKDLEDVMNQILEKTLSVLNCDRVYMAYPCDPDSPTWHVLLERNKPEFPGVLEQRQEIPINSHFREAFRILLSADGPVKFGPGTSYPIPKEISEEYGFKCLMAMAIYPQKGSPWQFGIHQCSHEREWTEEEERLFQEIGWRLADGLSTMPKHYDLQANMKKLEEAQDLAHIGNWELNLTNNVLSWSKEVYRIFEIDPQDFEATYEAFLNRVHPDDREIVDRTYNHSLKTKKPYSLDYRLILPDGRVKFVHHQCETYYDENRPICSVGTIQDITNRKQVELDLIKTNSLLNTVIEASPAAIIDLDLEGKVKSIWNPAAEKMLGWKAEETIGEFFPSVPPGKEEDFWRFQDAIRNGKILSGVEVKRKKKDGSPIDYSFYASPLRDTAGNITGNLAVLVDITEKKQAEKELIKYRDHLEELVTERTSELEIAKNKAQQYLDIVGVILIAIDLNKQVTLINQKGCDILGYSAEEIIGKNWFETFIPKSFYQTAMDDFWSPAIEAINPVEYFENPIVTKEGKERLIAWHNVLLRDNRGNITGTLSSGQDITEYRQAENQIKTLNQDLIERAKALEDANRELEAFAYSVSHDLRAPLRHIDGFVELLVKKIGTNLDEQCHHYVNVISKSAKTMGCLIDDLLAFSRLGRQPMSNNRIHLVSTIGDIIRELEPDLKHRTIDWQIGNLPTITGDASMLRVVLMNLISNAVKFTQTRKQAVIKIGCNYQQRETVIFVNDNGVGFDQEYKNKLFGVFQRLHRSEEFEGTGVGLAIAQRIIHRHGGRIWAKSEIENGAVFYFSIPIIESEKVDEHL